MKKILIADDSRIMRTWVKKILANKNFKIIEVNNGEQCLEKIEKEQVDIVLLDLLMPDFDGYYFLDKINEKKIHVNIIVLSADIQKTTQEKVMSYGVKAFLNKPPEPEILLKTIEQYLK